MNAPRPDSFPAHNTVLLETLKFDALNSCSLLFTEPQTILSTRDIGEVDVLLSSLDDYVSRGFYAAGFLAFEAGYAFVPALRKRLHGRQSPFPLLWFGIYNAPRIWDPRLERAPYINRPLVPNDGFRRPNRPQKQLRFDDYRKKIDNIKEYIRRGHTYQINFTWNTDIPFSGPAFGLYNQIKHIQPVSYAGYLDCGDMAILSFSPELFFRRSGRLIMTKPMKGTIARGTHKKSDEALMRQLSASEKNRAENLMIVDLLRNDLGRIARTGSVRVSRLFEIESYRTLFQMTSTIEATLESDVSYTDIFHSLFPCGSVTGAPKIRSMEIIRELEEENRGVYTGAVGFIAPDKHAVFNVAIRTPVIYNGAARLGIGSGIVWDSAAREEYRECLLKMDFLTTKQDDFEIYESLLWENGDYFLSDYHAERMAAGAAYFSFPFTERMFHGMLRENLSKLINTSAYKVKISLNRQGRFTITNEEIKPTKQNGLCIAVCGQPVSSNDPFLYHKTTRRDLYNEELKKAQAGGFWDVVFCNERSEITEGARSNIIIKENSGLFTPPVSCGLLAGTMRRYLLEQQRSITEAVITLPQLKAAEEIYMCNSVRKMVKVSLSDGTV